MSQTKVSVDLVLAAAKLATRENVDNGYTVVFDSETEEISIVNPETGVVIRSEDY